MDGTCAPEFAGVQEAFAEVMAHDRGGAAVSVWFRGEPVVDLWTGVRDAQGTPWTADTLAVSFSTTKGVTATALHCCVDRGLLDYDDPVARHWPEFAAGGKDTITVRQVLCHEAGLHDVASLLEHPRQLLDWDAMVDALARARPSFVPGSANAYHALTFGYLVGELVRRTSGRTITEFVAEEIAAPLGLDGCAIGLPESDLGRLATLLPPEGNVLAMMAGESGEAPGPLAALGESFGLDVDPDEMRRALGMAVAMEVLVDPRSVTAPIPAANGCFTARSLARMYQCLALGGTLDGTRLLSPETLARATEVQNDRPDRVIVFPMHWRLGYHLVFHSGGLPARAFGHSGFGGSGAWADPDRELSAAMTLNALALNLQGDPRFMSVGGAAAHAADALR